MKMAHSSENRIDLRGDGRIILYKRTGSKDPVWQVRIRVHNSTGYKRVTTTLASRLCNTGGVRRQTR